MVLEDAFRPLSSAPDGWLEAGGLCRAQKPEESGQGGNLGTSVFKRCFLRALGYISQGTVPHSRNNSLSFPV